MPYLPEVHRFQAVIIQSRPYAVMFRPYCLSDSTFLSITTPGYSFMPNANLVCSPRLQAVRHIVISCPKLHTGPRRLQVKGTEPIKTNYASHLYSWRQVYRALALLPPFPPPTGGIVLTYKLYME